MPLAIVVLPAPRLPIKRTTPRRGNSPASRSPSAMVSSSDAVRYVGTLLHGGGQETQNVGRDQALFAELARADLSGEAVQIDRGRNRLVGLFRKLRQQARDHPGEDVAAAAGAERGSTGRVDPDTAIGEPDHGALSFEDKRDAVPGSECARDADA